MEETTQKPPVPLRLEAPLQMDRELVWNRIAGSVQVLAKEKKLSVPKDLLSTFGNVWERDLKRVTALVEFCKSANITLYSQDTDWLAHLPQIANQLDDQALKAMGVTAETGKPGKDDKSKGGPS